MPFLFSARIFEKEGTIFLFSRFKAFELDEDSALRTVVGMCVHDAGAGDSICTICSVT